MEKLKNILNKFYFIYLGALPAVATFFLIQDVGEIKSKYMILLVIGTIIVAVYLAFIMSYLKPIDNIRRLLLIIIDGPLFAFIGSLNNIDISTIIITTFLIENVAIWISVGVLAIKIDEASKGQKIGSIILALLSIGGLVVMCYAGGFFIKEWYLYIPMVLGMIESIGFAYKTLESDTVVRDNVGYLIGFLFLRIAVMTISVAIHN